MPCRGVEVLLYPVGREELPGRRGQLFLRSVLPLVLRLVCPPLQSVLQRRSRLAALVRHVRQQLAVDELVDEAVHGGDGVDELVQRLRDSFKAK